LGSPTAGSSSVVEKEKKRNEKLADLTSPADPADEAAAQMKCFEERCIFQSPHRIPSSSGNGRGEKCRGGEMPHDSYEPGKSGIRSSSICSNPAFPAAALSSSVFTRFRRVDFSIFLLAPLSFRHWVRLRSMEWMGVEHGPPAVQPTICLGLGSYPSHGNLDELIINILIRGLFLCCD
jgi:hypothetical protein